MGSVISFAIMCVGAYALYTVGYKKLKLWLRALVRDEVELTNEKNKIKDEEWVYHYL